MIEWKCNYSIEKQNRTSKIIRNLDSMIWLSLNNYLLIEKQIESEIYSQDMRQGSIKFETTS